MWRTACDMVQQETNSHTDPDRHEIACRAIIEADSTLSFLAAHDRHLLSPMLDQYIHVPVHVLEIHDARILGLPGTVGSRVAHDLSESIGGKVWTAECINGNLQGAILTTPYGQPGTYRYVSGLFAPEGGESIARAALTLAAGEARGDGGS